MTTKPTNPKDALGSNKVPLHLWPQTATILGAMGLLDGALKYGRSNWRAVGIRASIYYDAVDRHMSAWFEGEDNDPDSGLPHLAHALAGLADTTVSDVWMKNLQRVETIIRQAGPAGILRMIITRKTRLRARDLDDLLRTLLEGGLIRIQIRPPSGAGRPANVFVHKDAQGDTDRRATYSVAQSLGAGMFISWQDPNKTDISGLPLFKGPPLGVGFHDPDDGSGSGGGVGPN
ncbi:hypothetical protein LCGC14_2250470 [marine sediment metagenome]|uniref:dATP/dGTP diphosphohydrolase N-terminal domain-containing protein n=1 Tax=marine sediment metagenome TaxID=412755 RepID=A0A0F9FXR9_9ZZZZ